MKTLHWRLIDSKTVVTKSMYMYHLQRCSKPTGSVVIGILSGAGYTLFPKQLVVPDVALGGIQAVFVC